MNDSAGDTVDSELLDDTDECRWLDPALSRIMPSLSACSAANLCEAGSCSLASDDKLCLRALLKVLCNVGETQDSVSRRSPVTDLANSGMAVDILSESLGLFGAGGAIEDQHCMLTPVDDGIVFVDVEDAAEHTSSDIVVEVR